MACAIEVNSLQHWKGGTSGQTGPIARPLRLEVTHMQAVVMCTLCSDSLGGPVEVYSRQASVIEVPRNAVQLPISLLVIGRGSRSSFCHLRLLLSQPALASRSGDKLVTPILRRRLATRIATLDRAKTFPPANTGCTGLLYLTAVALDSQVQVYARGGEAGAH